MVKLFYGNSQRVKVVGCFRREALSLMFDGVLNATPSEEKVSTTVVTQGNFELSLTPNCLPLHLHQTKKQ